MDELRAQMDGMRADFAMSRRRLEQQVEQLKGTSNNDDFFVGSIAGAAGR